MAEYPILAQKKIIIDSEAIEIFGYDNSTFTYNGDPIMPRFGGVTLQPIGSVPNANGATFVEPNLTLQPASASFGGIVNTGNQTFSGMKTLDDDFFLNGSLNFPAAGDATQSVIYRDGTSLFSCVGTNNNFFGDDSGNFTLTGTDNVGFGPSVCQSLTTGQQNVACGPSALANSTTSNDSTAIGYNALTSQTTGFLNTAVGVSSLALLLTGTNNVALGGNSGGDYTGAETGNLLLANPGTVGESNTIHIGSALHQSAYLGGTFGETSAGASTMVINVGGLMGTVVSTKKRKREIDDIPDDDLERFYKLIPKKFKMNNDVTNEQHWGLIAEDVDEIIPELVIYNDKKEPITVQYQKLDGLFLRAILSQKNEIEALKSVVQSLQSK